MNHFPVLQPRNLHAPCASQARARVPFCEAAAVLLCPRTWPARDPGAMQRQASTFLTLHIAHFTSELFSSRFMSSHMSATFFLAISCHLSAAQAFSCIGASFNSSRRFCTKKICWQITVAAFIQPHQYDLRSPDAKDNSITHAAVARSNLDAAITMRSAKTRLRNTIELRATASEIATAKPDLDAKAKKRQFWTFLKRIF